MKSPFQDRLANTNCKNCIFAIYDGDTQIGCSQSRLEKFETIEAYDLEKEFYVVKGFCNYHRPKTWNGGIADKDKVKNESSVTFDIIIDCSNINDEYMNSIGNLLSSIEYNKEKYKVVLCHSHISEKNVKNHVFKLYKSIAGLELSIYNDFDFYINNYIAKTRKTYHIYLSDNKLVDSNIMEKINNKINDDVLKLLTAHSNETNIVSNYAYKSIMGNKRSKYSEVIDFLIQNTTDKNMHFDI